MQSDFPAIRDVASVINISKTGDCIIIKNTFAECFLNNCNFTLGYMQGVDVGSVAPPPTFSPCGFVGPKTYILVFIYIYTRTINHS
jgi:hypothetical protein